MGFLFNVVIVMSFFIVGHSFLLTRMRRPGSTLYATTTTNTEPITDGQAHKYSFVQDDLRTYAMKLHTKDQSPKEGQKKAETPFTQWEPSRGDYLQFLVDSLKVYEALEDIVLTNPALSAFRNTGLERSVVLREDITWLCEYDSSLKVPQCGAAGKAYSDFLYKISSESLPKFMCHYYNHYFAHTAGGRMIGKKMSDKLLEGKTIKFYQWEGDVKVLLDNVRQSIDVMATTWNETEKQECLEETMACFRYGGSLVQYMRAPPAPAPASQ
eukprot:gene7745-15844_t